MSSCHSSSSSGSSVWCLVFFFFFLSSSAFFSFSFFLFSPGARGLEFEIYPRSKYIDTRFDSYSVQPWTFLISKSQTRFPSLHGGSCIVKVFDRSLRVHTSSILSTEPGYSMQHVGSCLDFVVTLGLHRRNLFNGLLVEYGIFHTASRNDILGISDFS